MKTIAFLGPADRTWPSCANCPSCYSVAPGALAGGSRNTSRCRHPASSREGRIAIVTKRGKRGRWTRRRARRTRRSRTAKSCGPDSSTLESSRRNLIFADDGDNEARSPERARRKPLKPLCRECRIAGDTCGDLLVCFFSTARQAAGAHRASGIPCALLLWRAEQPTRPRKCAEAAGLCPSTGVSARLTCRGEC